MGKGYNAVPVASDISVETDLIEQSRPLARWSGNRRKKPPHIEFANANTDTKLIEFVGKWGPVGARGCDVSHPSETTIVVRQDMFNLRITQNTFSTAARLIAEIQSTRPDLQKIFERLNCLWDLRWIHHEVFASAEQFFEKARAVYPGLTLGRAVSLLAEGELCRILLNHYPVRLYPTKWGPVEIPLLDTSGRGVRQVLYGLLRLEYLRAGRLGIGLCPQCHEVFAKERRGAVYCSEKCSKRHRSLDYYHEHGRAARQTRNIEKRKKHRGKKSLGPTLPALLVK
jgi:hypothetical protein